jgi:hypothetical protein
VLDQLGDPGRVGHVGLAAGHVVQVGRVQQPALHLALQQLPDRLPVAAGRLHPHPGHPEAGQPVGQQHQPGGGRGEPTGLGVAPTMTIRHPHTRGHRVLVHVQTRAAFDQRLHLLASSASTTVVAIRRSLYQRNLSLVLAATVRGARGSHVRLISGLSAPRKRRRRPDDRTFSSVAGGRARPWEAYQQSRAKRCADRHFPRSASTIGAKGMRSYSPPGSAYGRAAGAAGKVCQ